MNEKRWSCFWRGWLWLALFAWVGATVFHVVWGSGALLFSSDDNIGLISMNKRMLETSAVHPWVGDMLWGLAQTSSIRPSFLLLQRIPAWLFMNAYHGVCLGLAGWFLALYLRGKGLRGVACVFGGLTAFWVGTNLTLTYAGHIGKYGVMLFCAMALWALGRWGRSGKVAWGMVAAVAAGAMFLEQGDVALFCAGLLAPLGVYEGLQAAKISRRGVAGGAMAWGWIRQFVPALGVGVLLAGGAALATRGAGVTDTTENQSPQERWAFLTQWSQPPAESMDFIAPGWTGWRSGDEEGPYWGEMGRSEGWQQTGQGFMNFKLENVYVGAIPFFFAVLGLAGLWRRGGRGEASAAEDAEEKTAGGMSRGLVWMWGGLAVLALLLSFGKFTPLYRLVAALPGFSAIRNPNKFIHFFQMAWGVLAAVGLDRAMRMEGKAAKRWAWAGWGLAGIMVLVWANVWAGAAQEAQRLAGAGWGLKMGTAIVARKGFALLWCGISLGVAGAMMGVFQRLEKISVSFPMIGKNFPRCGKKEAEFSTVWKNFSTVWKKFSNGWKNNSTVWKTGVGAVAVIWIWVEAMWVVGPHYVQAMPKGYVEANALSRRLVAGAEGQEGSGGRKGERVAMAAQDGLYNLWLTYLFPYEGISSVNVTQLPRPPANYAAFWQAVQDPVRQWHLAAVGPVLAHGPVAAQLMGRPEWARMLQLDWAYRPERTATDGVETKEVPLEAARANLASVPEAVLRFREPVERVQGAARGREGEDAAVLRRLAAAGFEPGREVWLAPGSWEKAGVTPSKPGEAAAEAAEAMVALSRVKVEALDVRAGAYDFVAVVEGAAEVPAVVRVAESYHEGWKARVNGAEVPVLRCDYLFQAVALPGAGRYVVELRYEPSSLPVRMQGAGLALGLGAALWLAAGAFRRRRGTAEDGIRE